MKNYEDLLKTLTSNNYEICHFHQKRSIKHKQCFLRHDIDFSLEDALKISNIEKEFNVSSTFLFLIATDHYNLNSYYSRKIINTISKSHEIGLHFDASFQGDLLEEFNFQKNHISDIIKKQVSVFSFHRPASYGFPEIHDENVICTYDKKFFRDIPYISDSAGNIERVFKGVKECVQKELSFQLLIHPIWWVNPKSLDPKENVIRFKKERLSFLEQSYKLNCKIF